MNQPARSLTLTENELEDLIEKAVARALRDVGITASDARAIEDTRRDLFFLRDLRLAKESVLGKIVAAALTIVIGGVCFLLITGFRNWLR